MPAKSDFSIRKLIPQRQRGDHDTNTNTSTSTHEHHRHWLHPNLKPITARRGSAELPTQGEPAAPGDRYNISAPILPESGMMSYSFPNSSFERTPRESAWLSAGSRACSPAPGLGRSISPARPWSPAEASRPATPVHCGVFPSPDSKAGEEVDTGAVRPRRPSSPLLPPPISIETKKRSSIVPVTVLESGWIDEAEPSTPVWKLAAEKKKKHARTRRHKDDGLELPRREKQPRWTFTENVTELFTGQLFRRMEAEETITPEQVNEFRRRRQSAEGEEEETLGESEAERLLEEERKEREEEERWLEGLRAAEWPRRENDGDETPQEPFYLDHLSSAIEAMLASTAAAATSGDPAEESGFGAAIQRDFSVRRKPVRKTSLRKKPLRPPPSTPLPSIPSIPIPPRNPARQAWRAPMPTIPEVRVTPAGNPRPHPQPSPISLKATEDDDFVFLRSTPCTLTMPSFKHGPVRIAKSDLGPVIDVDDTLDWTAFQMAILGAGDFFCDSPVFCSGSGSEEEEVTGLETWVGDLGLGVGALVCEEEGDVAGTRDVVEEEQWNSYGNEEEGGECEYGDGYEDEYEDDEEEVMEEEAVGPSPSTAEFSPLSCSSSCYSGDDDLPIPLETEFPNSVWSGTDGRSSGGELKRSLGRGIRRWAIDLPPRRDSRSSAGSSRSSAGSSLPKSPMLTINFGGVKGVGNGRVTGGVSGGGKGRMPGEEGRREMVEIRRGGSGIGDAWSRGEDVVPMGYNLGHDLGEFLRWEADNVYAVEV